MRVIRVEAEDPEIAWVYIKGPNNHGRYAVEIPQSIFSSEGVLGKMDLCIDDTPKIFATLRTISISSTNWSLVF